MHRSSSRILRPFAFALLVIASLVPDQASAQFVRAYVVEDSVTVGDHFTIVMVAEHSQPDSVGFPEFSLSGEGHAIGDVLLLSRHSFGRRLLGVGNRYPIADTVAYRATTFAIDSAVVASIPFSFVSVDRSTTRQTDPFSFPVASVLTEDSVELRDIEPLASFPRSMLPYLVLLLGLLAGFAYYRWLNRPRPEVVAPPPPVRRPPPAPVESPLAEANRRLSVLEETDLVLEESTKPYYVELSEILRTYIERRIHLTALESTSGELIAAMRDYLPRTPIPNEVVKDLTAILETSDLAKFADVQHPIELSQVTLTETRVLILRIEDSFRPARTEPVEPTVSEGRNGNPIPSDHQGAPAAEKNAPGQEEGKTTPTRSLTAASTAAGSVNDTRSRPMPARPTPEAPSILFINDTDPEELISESLTKKPTRSGEDWAPPELRKNEDLSDSSPIAAALRKKELERIEKTSSEDEESSDGIVEAASDPVIEVDSVSVAEPESQEVEPPLESSDDPAQLDVDEWIRNAPGARRTAQQEDSSKPGDSR